MGLTNPDLGISSSSTTKTAIFEDERPYNTYGGGTTGGAWYARTLTNTVVNQDSSAVELQRFAVVAVTTGAGGHLDIAGDQTSHFSAGRWFSLYENTGYSVPNASSPTPFIVSSVSYDAGSDRTLVYPTASVNVATSADGYLCTGRIILRGGSGGRTFRVTALPECNTYNAVARLSERTGCTYSTGQVTVGATTSGWSVSTPAGTTVNMPCRLDTVITVAASAVEYWEVHELVKSTSSSVGLGDRSSVNAAFTERYCRVIVEF